MAVDRYSYSYNPDVLSCLANLSSDEVFTPPALVNQMLDLLPQSLWSDPSATFLDPACKSGVFLREIAKRLLEGLKDQIPDLQTRIDHIFQKQLFGIAITELTSLLSRRSLYCSKYPNGHYSITPFDKPAGNIQFHRIDHTWCNGRCAFCGASQSEYDRGPELETHSYGFIHTVHPEELFNMKFDVIIGNPPYQLSDGGFGVSAKPIYQFFIIQAKKLNPRFLTMIIPSRWFAGGKGLDSFREEMLTDDRLRIIHDYFNAADVFPGVEVKSGVCYFLWDRDNRGDCNVITHNTDGSVEISTRPLLEENVDIFIRHKMAVSVLKKVKSLDEVTFDTLVSSRKPFGFPTNYKGSQIKTLNDIALFERGFISYIPLSVIERNRNWVEKYKIFISKAYNAGDKYPHQIINKPILANPYTCCTETYLVIGPFDSEETTRNVVTYISTRFFRFLVFLRKISQDATSKVYSFVPIQDFSQQWTDEELYKKYSLTVEEIEFIESMIRPMDLNSGESDD